MSISREIWPSLLPWSDFQRGYLSSSNVDVFITFKVMVRANHLWGGNHYNDYQEHLYDLITNKLDDGWNYQLFAVSNHETSCGAELTE